ncbi:hypothetical protein P152DRAFT_483454 [Eremomyces bilateralis CBS 781.70]|uniref:S-adenosyl-L-methionine-dependent methyltransferase n=1 Tax=Eremomyces bilateralis CBS 781.70 TaxID=1392243 RepID=A0A6G1FZ69_9PEZI|nr:uncharacterized protein P152DRAFT_483454 [Eremomyces bilateralis CBS 781.70]KAF1811147.1 hypothetical protein P152DRAFT_483454 [Eremomyces bilateralis CBS 781.70]
MTSGVIATRTAATRSQMFTKPTCSVVCVESWQTRGPQQRSVAPTQEDQVFTSKRRKQLHTHQQENGISPSTPLPAPLQHRLVIRFPFAWPQPLSHPSAPSQPAGRFRRRRRPQVNPPRFIPAVPGEASPHYWSSSGGVLIASAMGTVPLGLRALADPDMYPLPPIETQPEFIQARYWLVFYVMGYRLYRSPITGQPTGTDPEFRVLDINPGLMWWGAEMRGARPSVNVFVVDTNPLPDMEGVRSVEAPADGAWVWAEDKQYDFVHGMDLEGSVRNWRMLQKLVLDGLKPGGWWECSEFECKVRSEADVLLTKAPFLATWNGLIEAGLERIDSWANLGRLPKQIMELAGFEDVTLERIPIPSGAWSPEPKMRGPSMLLTPMFVKKLEPAMEIYSRILALSEEASQHILNGIRKELEDPENELSLNLRIVYGRRPLHIPGGSEIS